MAIRRNVWNTYATTGYTYDIGNDPRSQGGVHIHQVRRTNTGHWQKRIMQSNGKHVSYGDVVAVNDAEGEALFAQAQTY